MLIKLKAVYTLVEQLYSGSQRALAVVALSNTTPHLLQDVLKHLAMLPQRIQDLRRASARAGAVAALSRAKAWLPELDPAELALGYPSRKEDGIVFDDHDFIACVLYVSWQPLLGTIPTSLSILRAMIVRTGEFQTFHMMKSA